MVSAHNPFRTPAVSPNPTGTLAPAVPATFSLEVPEDAEGMPGYLRTSPPAASTPARTPSPASSAADPSRSTQSLSLLPPDDDIISEELPPAYTPTPDVVHGESTIELGPRRPFQAPPGIPRQHQLRPQHIGWQVSQSTGSSSWSSFPGGRHGSPAAPSVAPPPQHPSLNRGRPSTAPSQPPGPLSDFAREFYAAGAEFPNGQTEASSSSGPSASQSRPNVLDDGRPTEVPTPGHPLLRHGQVLVYPEAYECGKCRNIGYRNNDPSMPCSKCWEKYARPFTGAVTYAPWGAPATGSASGSRNTYQRPLPRFTPPHLSAPSKHRPTQSYSGLSAEPPLPPRSEGASLT
ncbi:uncharacterized protein FIBRA_04736 [Fibroporia radiculosa]|uniref:Uncharacterized protein n=1 Tax=Fibroporia radiculosa TaxID=599839 RepID=J4HWP7_9APHY|nr:uncharacterized protein FIBRA_04736 [Fibroporia radiculosa]CCM02632.1 predicted protein [Fibroporia radiculosa]